MTTEIKVNVMGYAHKWQPGQGKEYYTGTFIFQQVSPPGPVLIGEDGSINLDALGIEGQVDIVYRWLSPMIGIEGELYATAFSPIAKDNFWVLAGNGKPNKNNQPLPGGQFEVSLDSPNELRVSDANSDKGHYTYCLAIQIGIDNNGDGTPDWFVADPKITNRGNDRIIRLSSYESA